MRGLSGHPQVPLSEMKFPTPSSNQPSTLRTSVMFPSFPLHAGVSLEIGIL